MSGRGLRIYEWVFEGVPGVEKLFEAKYSRRYNARPQLMAYQIQMLHYRIDTDRVYTRPEERAELTRIGQLLGHDIDDVMPVVKPNTYYGWLRPKEEVSRWGA